METKNCVIVDEYYSSIKKGRKYEYKAEKLLVTDIDENGKATTYDFADKNRFTKLNDFQRNSIATDWAIQLYCHYGRKCVITNQCMNNGLVYSHEWDSNCAKLTQEDVAKIGERNKKVFASNLEYFTKAA